MEQSKYAAVPELIDDRRARHIFQGVSTFLALLIAAVCVLTVLNTVRLRTYIDQKTKAYVGDVAYQLASDIDYRLMKLTQDLELLENSLVTTYGQDDRAVAEAYLQKKAGLLGFSSLLLLRPETYAYSTDGRVTDYLSLPGVQASLSGDNGVSFLNEQSILYTIPVYLDGKVTAVLGGFLDKERMQELIQPRSFGGKGLICITDCEGRVILSPTDVEPFLELDNIFVQKTDAAVVENIERMREDMRNHRDGVLSFTAVDGSELVMSYHALGIYDWVILTLVPADILSQETDQYITETFAITAVIILLFSILMIGLMVIYRRNRKTLEKVAFTDALTSGINVVAFQLRCRDLLRIDGSAPHTIVYLHIQGFRLIYETYGGEAGNATLRYIADVLSRRIRAGELVAREDADFYLLLRENQPEEIQRRLEELTEAVNDFNRENREPYYFVLMAGAYIVEEPSLEIPMLQDRAKAACQNRQAGEGGCAFYDVSFMEKLKRDYELTALFEQSLKNRDFQVYLQPKIRIDSEKIGGAEALVRWVHPQMGVISPADFIPLCEKNGTICRLDLFVFEEVCVLLERWIREGRTPFPISVNLSRRHFQQPDFLLRYAEIVREHHIPAGLLEMELTESIFFEETDIERVPKQIARMHELGFTCSLDDFGAGFSSLGLLKVFPVDSIKLDRSFFLRVEKERTETVVASMVELSKKLGITTVAEGIETPEQLEVLRRVRCDMVQGYIFSRPLPVAEFEQWMADWTAAHP